MRWRSVVLVGSSSMLLDFNATHCEIVPAPALVADQNSPAECAAAEGNSRIQAFDSVTGTQFDPIGFDSFEAY
jgi:hypothetical protein